MLKFKVDGFDYVVFVTSDSDLKCLCVSAAVTVNDLITKEQF